ncbi:Maf family protein [Methylocapsa sp. S129]|uniref:Maf family protein n=1 Tax=Methylocapsa sp. S129 TaxID=1641869 RepID=UPI001FED2CEE|nr:Maf family protein [Methylocapsa sp. S129]
MLASKSATRRLLLENAGIEVEVEAAEIDERRLEQAFLEGGAAPSELAPQLARAKALDVSVRRPQVLCFGADQTLLLEDKLFHKPNNMEAAEQSLKKLAGRTHTLIAAVCVARDGAVLFETTQNARLTMRALDESFIRLYLAAAGPAVLSSVGAYQIEGIGIHLFETIEGDHATILGLPLMALMKWLRSQRFLAT